MPHSFFSNYPLDMPAEEVADRHAPLLAATYYYADGFPWVWMNFCTGIVAGFLGAKVHSVAQPSEDLVRAPRRAQIKDVELTYDSISSAE